MADASILNRFATQGIQPIAIDAGCQTFLQELELGAKGDAEVILGDGPWPRLEGAGSTAMPLLHGSTLLPQADGSFESLRYFDPTHDAFLRDHQMDGRPVLPAAVAIELMAETLQRGNPGREVREITDLRVLKGVVLGEEGRWLRVIAVPGSSKTTETTAEVRIHNAVDSTLHYRATAQLTTSLQPAYDIDQLPFPRLNKLPMGLKEAERLLFQGPAMRGIDCITAIGPDGVEAELRSSSPKDLIDGVESAGWMFDPRIVDSALQLAIIWYRVHHDVTPLPSRFVRLRRFAVLPHGLVRCQMRVRASGGHMLTADYMFSDSSGRPLAALDGMEYTGSRALNRLADAALGNTS